MGTTAEAWPFVGRRAEVDAVAAALRRRGGAGALLAGPSGVGKTRLLDECLHLAAAAGMATLRTSGSLGLRDAPLGALLPLLPPDVVTDPASALAAGRRLLQEHADGRRALLAVDDAHLLDDASIWVLRQVATARELSVLLSTRDGAPVPDALARFWLDGLVERIEVAPLDDDRVGVLLHRALGAPVDRAALATLAGKARGNVLFLRELVLGAQASGALVLRDGAWSLVGAPAPTSRLRELVGTRLAGCSPADREALELLALAYRLGLGDLQALVPDADLLSLEGHGLLRVERDERRTILAVAHPVHADVLLAELPALRGVALRRRLADHLEAVGSARRGDAVRVALLRLDAGDRPDAEVLVAAAHVARAAHDYRSTARLAELASNLQPTAAMLHLLGDARSALGEHDAADAALQRAAALADTDADRIGIAVSRIDLALWGYGDPEGAMSLAEASERALPAAAALFVPKRASLAAFEGRADDALALLDGAVPDEPRTAAQIAMARSLAAAVAGRFEVAIRAADDAVAASEALDGAAGLIHPVAHRVSASLAIGWAGELPRALTLAAEGHELASTGRLSFVACKLGLVAARLAILRGELDAARRWASGVVAEAEARHRRGLVRPALALRAVAAAGCGDTGGAAQDVEAIAALGDVGVELYDLDVARARAWVAALAGDRSGAEQLLGAAVDRALAQGATTLALEGAHDLVRLAGPAAGAAAIRGLAPRVEGPLAAALVQQVEALLARDGDRLEEAARVLEHLGLDVLAAETWAAAATAWAGSGQARRAAAASTAVGRLRAAHPEVATPGLLLAPAATPLTAREREIALLVAGGRTSREVAEQLVLSVRTVDNHLQRAFGKLGISSRAELAAALGLPSDGRDPSLAGARGE